MSKDKKHLSAWDRDTELLDEYLNQKPWTTEGEEMRRGKLIAEGLGLKRDRTYPDRYRTKWGTKTDLGLFRILQRFIQDGEWPNSQPT